MKSLRNHSFNSRGKDFMNKSSTRKKCVSYIDRPTPLDFDAFVPWFCLELQVPKNIIITRNTRVEYISYNSRVSKVISKPSKSKSRNIKIKSSTDTSERTVNKIADIRKISSLYKATDIKDVVPITTYYDKHGHLVEIAIVGCAFSIPRKVIQAFNLCLPFHSGLSKLSILKGGIDHIVLYEISKLLPHSNLTDICLDDSFVPAGNYSLLLDQPSQLKYLSLKRCGINSEQCKTIAEKIDLNGTAAKTLLLLDLTSNKISDKGAQALGEILKKNRYLLYLNLSDNDISDFGAAFILKYLKEFPLSFDDIKERSCRRFTYLKYKAEIYNKYLEEEKLARLYRNNREKASSIDPLFPLIDVPKKGHRKKSKVVVPSIDIIDLSVEDVAEKKTDEVLEKNDDPFKDEYTKREGDLVYAVGNFTLCYLNLAYNELTLLTIRTILDILKYQTEVNKIKQYTGLMKVVVDGNKIQRGCYELDEIELCLKRVISKNEPHNSNLSSYTSSLSEKRN